MLFWEEWKRELGSRMKTVALVGLALLVVVQWGAENGKYAVEKGREAQGTQGLVQPEQWQREQAQLEQKQQGRPEQWQREQAQLEQKQQEQDRPEQWQQKQVQLKLDACEQEFHETIKTLCERNLWNTAYAQEAEAHYMKYADAMSWTMAYYQYRPEDNSRKVVEEVVQKDEQEGTQGGTQEDTQKDLILQKAIHMTELIQMQTDYLNEMISTYQK